MGVTVKFKLLKNNLNKYLIKEKTEKLQQIIKQINAGRQQIVKLEQEGLMVQGELRLLNQLESEKEPKKATKK